MIGLVLAAGAGRRLRPYTDRLPKALVPVDGDRTVLDVILANFAQVGLTDVAVVVGYAAEAVVERQRELEQRHGVRLQLVKNDRAEEWKIELDAEGALARINKGRDPATAAGEYIGVTLIEPAAAEPLTSALEATWRRDPGLYYEDGYQEYVDRGMRIDICPIGEGSWGEVDDTADLERGRVLACHY